MQILRSSKHEAHPSSPTRLRAHAFHVVVGDQRLLTGRVCLLVCQLVLAWRLLSVPVYAITSTVKEMVSVQLRSRSCSLLSIRGQRTRQRNTSGSASVCGSIATPRYILPACMNRRRRSCIKIWVDIAYTLTTNILSQAEHLECGARVSRPICSVFTGGRRRRGKGRKWVIITSHHCALLTGAMGRPETKHRICGSRKRRRILPKCRCPDFASRRRN